ncbi:kinase-like protein [Rostrohypoxylon terebratum]|nr:kinase-like protein [Rostrohypoxylon terebratum]
MDVLVFPSQTVSETVKDETESEGIEEVSDLGWTFQDIYWGQCSVDVNPELDEKFMSIQQMLDRESKFPPGEGNECFIPLNIQDTIISHDRVERELKAVLSGKGSENVKDLVEYICGTPNGGSAKRARKIFAILSLMDKQNLICDFYNERIYDGDLPLRKSGVGGKLKLIAKRRYKDFELKCCSGWSAPDKDIFFSYQWRMLSPFFGTRDGNPPFYNLESGVILPWTACSLLEDTIGGNSDVSRISIHDAHHGFGKNHNESFALKVLHSKNRRVFQTEFEALKKVETHDHLVPVLAAFTHQEKYYMIFPWAENGNLSKLINKTEVRNEAGMTYWVVSQCYGLATAIKHIHNISIPIKSQPHENEPKNTHGRTQAKVFGRHGDIKPSNVLLFQDDNLLNGRLKICDFGLTIFHSEKSKSMDHALGGNPLSYSPPEMDGISRKFDIWCLGCLYLELLTWLILGPQGVENFNQSRFDEHGSDTNWSTDQFFKTMKGESGGSYAVIKKSVTEHILRLESHQESIGYVKEFLKLIRNQMLVINHERRIDSDNLELKLRNILESYALNTAG